MGLRCATATFGKNLACLRPARQACEATGMREPSQTQPNASPAKVRHTDAAHHLYSSLREKIVEHVFVGDALRILWRRGVFDVEVLRSDFDAHGYDLVLVRGKVVRHIQFKTGIRDKPKRVSVASALAEKPSGCVIWIQVDNDLNMKRFWWLGAGPEEPLPALGGRLTKRIARTKEGIRPLREKHRTVNGSLFRSVDTIGELLEILFGDLPAGAPPIINDEGEGD